jgi:thioesterase domain-containing protein
MSTEPGDSQILRMERLAQAAFSREVLRKVADVILPLNDIGTGAAFYCVHSITGAATNLRFIARALGPKQKFYGIQTPTSQRNAGFPSSIEAISRYYVRRLVDFQPTGNFVLGGHSVGAMIALEMARQLRSLGRNVDLVVVLDGEIFNTGGDISPYNPIYWIKLLLNVPSWTRDFVMVEFTVQTFFRTVFHKAIAVAKTIATKMRGGAGGHAVEGFIDLSKCTPDHAAFMKRMFEVQYDYIPRQYSGRVLVCMAKTHALTHLKQLEATWPKIAPNSEVVRFSGTHTSILNLPNVLPVAERLARKFQEIDESNERERDLCDESSRLRTA